jgi:hypothetical protein
MLEVKRLGRDIGVAARSATRRSTIITHASGDIPMESETQPPPAPSAQMPDTPFDAAALLACHIFALWIAFQAIQLVCLYLKSATSFLRTDSRGTGPAYGLLLIWSAGPLLMVGVAWLVWAIAPWIARKMARRAPSHLSWPALDQRTVLGVAGTVLGLLLLITALPQLVRLLAEMVIAARRNELPQVASSYFASDLLGALAECGLGLWLTVKARGIAHIIVYLRNAGRKTQDPAP